jgi:phytoene dehydrogenase-like protein
VAANYDAVVVGSGPNGLAAAIEMARAGRSVVVYEAADTIGGGTRSAELTLPGYTHDVCAAVHPLGASTWYFRSLPLEAHGLEWVHPPLPLAHPFDDGTAAVLERNGERTAERLGDDDMAAYRQLIAPIVKDWPWLEREALAPFVPLHWPEHPAALARFGLRAARSTTGLARALFKTAPAQALLAGLAAHSGQPLEARGSVAIALILAAAAHRGGWPFAKGGSQAIANALASYLRSLGGEIATGRPVASLAELPQARTILCDVAPERLADLARLRIPARYRRALQRFRRGPGVFKMDWALRQPIPWTALECAAAGTVHLGGTLEQIAASEAVCAPGALAASPRPFVLLSQPTCFDPSRAPEGRHTAWAYCHVPNGSDQDMAAAIEAQVERFAPGFRDLILARSARGALELERHNPNLVGGDIVGGANTLRQLLARPTLAAYSTPMPGVYLCSASTPPGGGVHGLCGVYAARRALAASN